MESNLRESDVLRQCLDYLKLAHPDWLVWRQNQGAIPLKGGGYRRFVGLRGVSDILCILPPAGRICCIEVKKLGGRTSPEQKSFLEKVDGLGGVAIVCSSLEELQEDLKSLGL